MLAEAVGTAFLAMLSVGLWTVRVAITARGNRVLGSLVAAIEATVFAVAFSRLLEGLDSPHRIVAYGVGVVAGTLLGLTLDSMLNPQSVRVDIVDTDRVMVAALDRDGWPRTSSSGFGATGPVAIVSVTTSEARLPELIGLVASASPAAFWTVTPVRRVRPSPFPGGSIPMPDAAPTRARGTACEGDRWDRPQSWSPVSAGVGSRRPMSHGARMRRAGPAGPDTRGGRRHR